MKKKILLVLALLFVGYSVVSYATLTKQERCVIQEKIDAGQKPWNINEGYNYELTCALRLSMQDAMK